MGWVSSLEDRIERLNEDLRSFREDTARLALDPATAPNRRAELRREFAILCAQADLLHEEVKRYAVLGREPSVRLADAYQAACRELESLREAVKKLEALLTGLRASNEVLQARLAATAHVPDLHRRLGQMEGENRRLRERLFTYQERVSGLLREIADLRSQLISTDASSVAKPSRSSRRVRPAPAQQPRQPAASTLRDRHQEDRNSDLATLEQLIHRYTSPDLIRRLKPDA